MSFENYQNFPSQQGGQDGGPGPGGPPQQDQQMGGQMPDNGGQFPGGDPVSAGGQSQGGDEKTTLWYEKPMFLVTRIFISIRYNSPDRRSQNGAGCFC